MYTRLIIEFNVTRVRDFSKNIKTLSAKYFYHEPLFTSFCRLVERDIDENCYCSKELSLTKFLENGTYRIQNLANFIFVENGLLSIFGFVFEKTVFDEFCF